MAPLNLPAASFLPFDPDRYVSKVRYFRLARHALAAAFNCIQIAEGDRVLMPEFICRDLLAPIHAAGAVPVFYEVDNALRPLELPVLDRVRAVLAVNYFGFPQELQVFRNYCACNGAVLIEDNAHGFLSCDASGRLLGERGDFGLFSIRKTFLLPDGAMLMVNSPVWQHSIGKQLRFRRELLPLSFWVYYTLSWLERKSNIAFRTAGQELIRQFRYFRTGHAIAPMLSEDEFEMPSDPAPQHVSMSMFKQLDFDKEIKRRRSLYVLFHELLASMHITPLFNDLPAGTVPYGYPFFAEKPAAQDITRLARSRGFDCIQWPALPSVVEPHAPLHYRTLWMVNFLC